MDPFKFYNHVRLKEKNWDSLLSLIPEFIQIGKDTETEMLQYEAFANHDRKEVIWMESFRQKDGFDSGF